MPQRKVFRIEQASRLANPAVMPPPCAAHEAEGDAGALRHRELMAELKALRGLLEQGIPESRRILDQCRTEIANARAMLHGSPASPGAAASFPAPVPVARMKGELDAVVRSTEEAAHRILAAAEEIDQRAGALGACLDDAHGHHGDAIQQGVGQIFEACCFQDIAGQRINKVIATLRVVEEQVMHSMEVWQNLDDAIAAAAAGSLVGNEPVHGPALTGDSGHVTQAEIDALFRQARN